MIHDTNKLQAAHAGYRKAIEEATKDLDAQIAALTAKRNEIIHQIYTSKKTFSDGLIYSATARCKCGAGLCYEEGSKADAWSCSACVMADHAKLSMEGWDKNAHQSFPFAFYEIKSENQPSAMGQTTRAQPVEIVS